MLVLYIQLLHKCILSNFAQNTMINVRAIDIPFLHLSLVILALGIAEVVLVRTLAHDFNQWPASSTGLAQHKYDVLLFRISLNTAPEGLEIVSGAFAIAAGSIGLVRWVLVVKSWRNEEDEVVAQVCPSVITS